MSREQPESASPGAAKDASLAIPFASVRRRLLAWFDRNGRDYPWRHTGNWFHLLMAEMMLRRTRADQVLPVYERFVARFPSAMEAAEAGTGELEAMLEPLGLLWRARHVGETIAYIRDSYGKRSPSPDDDLKSIPGVGDYSNAMLRNRLFDEPEAAIDSNVARFLLRLAGLPFHAESRRSRIVIEAARQFVRGKRSKELNLAMIDFSALICKPQRPLCPQCPLQSDCATYPLLYPDPLAQDKADE